MQDYCGDSLLGGVNNMTVPLTSIPYIDMLNLPLSDYLNSTVDDFNTWDVPTLKLWVEHYVDYHNAVAAFANAATNATTEAVD